MGIESDKLFSCDHCPALVPIITLSVIMFHFFLWTQNLPFSSILGWIIAVVCIYSCKEKNHLCLREGLCQGLVSVRGCQKLNCSLCNSTHSRWACYCSEILPQTYFFSVEITWDFCPTRSTSVPESLCFVICVEACGQYVIVAAAEVDELFKLGFVFNHNVIKAA